jgi:hypothetical protein
MRITAICILLVATLLNACIHCTHPAQTDWTNIIKKGDIMDVVFAGSAFIKLRYEDRLYAIRTDKDFLLKPNRHPVLTAAPRSSGVILDS